MKIKYLGPNDHVVVGSYGVHYRDEIKEYPDDFAKELLATSVRQRFEGEGSIESKTVAELTTILEAAGIEIPPKARKAELIEMLKKLEEGEPAAAEKS